MSCWSNKTVPETSRITGRLRPIAVTSVAMKCFEQLVRDNICPSLPSSLDPLQFVHWSNGFTDDAITHVRHCAPSHLDRRGGTIYACSSWITVWPSILLFPTSSSQSSGTWGCTPPGTTSSFSITLSTGVPQGSVLRPLLYSQYTSDCVATSSSNRLVNNTMVVISNNDERPYLGEVENLTSWCNVPEC